MLTASEIIITQPAYGNILSLDEVKEHLRVDGNDEDAFILALTASAYDFIAGKNGYLGRSLLPQTLQATYEGSGDLELRYPPIIEVQGVTVDGVPFEDYRLVRNETTPYLISKQWPRGDVTVVTYRAGYLFEGSPAQDTIPPAIKHGMLLVIGDLYHNREGQSEKKYEANPTVQRLLQPWRCNIGA
jgi:uncharacterized phiE125 gp8 family phage protein